MAVFMPLRYKKEIFMTNIGFIGTGNMGTAIIKGIAKSNWQTNYQFLQLT